MAYVPSEKEKKQAVLMQGAAIVLLFLPPAVLLASKGRRLSPFMRYWAKANLIWSVLATVLIVAAAVAGWFLQTANPLICTIVLHVVLCVMAAFAASLNLPFGYLFVGSCFCSEERFALTGR
jgi:hypothetical protein